jgi:hypothetical protein
MLASPEALWLRPLFGSSTCVESRRPRPYEDRCSLPTLTLFVASAAVLILFVLFLPITVHAVLPHPLTESSRMAR